jgi:carboxylesterase type B
MIGSSRGLEIPFIFGEWTYGYIGQFIFRTDNAKGREALSDSMVKYWAFFARTGNPADPSGVVWKPWSNKEAGAKRIIFDADDTESIIKMSNQ